MAFGVYRNGSMNLSLNFDTYYDMRYFLRSRDQQRIDREFHGSDCQVCIRISYWHGRGILGGIVGGIMVVRFTDLTAGEHGRRSNFQWNGKSTYYIRSCCVHRNKVYR
jgi:hypothetical protein